MMRPLNMLTSLVLLAGVAAAQSAPLASPLAASSAASAPQLGAPRVYSEGSMTRVVYDLPAGVGYTLTPSFGGLRVELRNLRATPSGTQRLGASIGQYRVTPTSGGATLSFNTPFPLGLKDGWKATEATIASGTRVLILEIGPAVSGGRMGSAAVAQRSAVVPPPLPNIAISPPVTPPVQPDQPVPDDQLAPGDTVTTLGEPLPAPAAKLPGAQDSDPNVLSGQALGSARPGASLNAPRIGINPGVTRVVLDLPPGATFRVQPSALGLNIDVTGVTTSVRSQDDISPELRGWRYQASGSNLRVSLMTGSAVTAYTGWRSVFLPPTPGSSNSRLAIDLSPAYANTTPLKVTEKIVAAVPPVRSSAMAFSGAPAMMVPPSVVIDPGHGGTDPGAIGSVIEKEINLDIALRVRRYLQAAGVNVILTRDHDTQISRDKATDLNARAAMGYKGARFFLSIHANSMPAKEVLHGYGVETWWNANNEGSSAFASIIQDNVVSTAGAFSKGLKTGRSLAVLRGSRIPAALIEVGFVSHPVDGNNLKDDNYRERVALGIAKGIREALVSGLNMSATK